MVFQRFLKEIEISYEKKASKPDWCIKSQKENPWPNGKKDLLDLEVTNWRFISKTKQDNLHPKYFVGKDEGFMIYPMSNKKTYCYAQISDKGNKYKNSDFIAN